MDAAIRIVDWESSALFVERRLPQNYLPAALGALAGRKGGQGRHLFALRAGRIPRTGIETFVVDAATLADPEAMAAFVAQVFPEDQFPGPVYLGPVASADPGGGARVVPLQADPHNATGDVDSVAVVIDSGIAFWDAAFRHEGQSSFREMVFLDFDLDGGGNAIGQRLGRQEIAALCALADTEGTEAVMTALSARPTSFYGPEGEAAAHQGWHGTGIADLVAGGAAGDRVALFGVELPTAVTRDHDGDSLSAVLALTIEMVLAATEPLGHLPLVIALPFGFVAGPQDGTHPVAVSVGDVLMGTRGIRDVTLVVPAGNHRQDRCTARIVGPGEVVWRIAPDDHSPNAMQIIMPDETAGLWLAPPGQGAIPILPSPGRLSLIQRGQAVIGAIHRQPDTSGRVRLRLTLGPTGRADPGDAIAPFGDWRIGLAGDGTADLFILRDDRDPVTDRGRPHRGAVFDAPGYVATDPDGAPVMPDRVASVVRRAGTASILTTIPGVVPVGAAERLGSGAPRTAWYCGAPTDGADWAVTELVDDGWPSRGVDCAANGSAQRHRMSGTSAAAALRARRLLNLPPRGPDRG